MFSRRQAAAPAWFSPGFPAQFSLPAVPLALPVLLPARLVRPGLGRLISAIVS